MIINKKLFIMFFCFSVLGCSAEILQDDLAEQTLKGVSLPYTHTNYNYENTDIVPVKLSIVNEIKSEQDLYEGQEVEFRLVKSVIYNNKIIAKRGTIVKANVKMIIASGMNGIPASIIFENFKIQGIARHKLTDSYEVYGQDRSLFVFPLKWALTPLPPTGSLTNFIKGGHAKLKPNKTITLYYHPNWESYVTLNFAAVTESYSK